MSSAAIRAEIDHKKAELHQAQQELQEARQDCENIEALQAKVKSEHWSFLSSLDARRSRLGKIGGLVSSVKIAKAYQDHTSEMLTGRAFGAAEAQYAQMEDTITTQWRRICDLIDQLENRIATLQNQISSLEVEYGHAVAREEEERRAREREAQNGR